MLAFFIAPGLGGGPPDRGGRACMPGGGGGSPLGGPRPRGGPRPLGGGGPPFPPRGLRFGGIKQYDNYKYKLNIYAHTTKLKTKRKTAMKPLFNVFCYSNETMNSKQNTSS